MADKQKQAWFRRQVRRFKSARPRYVQLGDVLQEMLGKAAHGRHLHVIVQARAKALSSFSEKILRKGKGYAEGFDPLSTLTDLCGARVICQTLPDVEEMAAYVESTFEIDWENSGDKASELVIDRFGYLSRHYIVSLPKEPLPGFKRPRNLTGLKAEIQVRTLLQHAWADIFHSIGYKGSFDLPDSWKRDFYRLAAVLEKSDHDFARIQEGLREYYSSYTENAPEAVLKEEFERLRMVLDANPGDVDLTHRLAKIAFYLGDYKTSAALLEPLKDSRSPAVLRDLGVSLCKQYREKRGREELFEKGKEYLQRAVEIDPGDSDAWASLGGAWKAIGNHAHARACYQKGYEADPADPYPLGNLLQYAIDESPGADVVAHFRPAILSVMDRCRHQISVGMNLPWAHYDLAKFSLFLDRPADALRHTLDGAHASTAGWFLQSALRGLDDKHLSSYCSGGVRLCREFLELALAVSHGGSTTPLADRSDREAIKKFAGPILIVAGACRPDAFPTDRKQEMSAMLSQWRGTIISGGTRAGVAEVVGEASAAEQSLTSIGYTPLRMPAGIELDNRYAYHRRTEGDGFSPLEPLAYWADLVSAGVHPGDVTCLCLGGGELSATECLLAALLGARVGAVPQGAKPILDLREVGLWTTSERVGLLDATPEEIARFLGISS